MRLTITAVALFVAAAVAVLPAVAAPPTCGTPVASEDGWRVEGDPAHAGFAPAALCDAVRSFAESPRNLHALVVERHGRLVAEAYRDGDDRSTYSPRASRTRFDADALHDVRSITKSVVALLWAIAEADGRVPNVAMPVLDLLPALRREAGDHATRIARKSLTLVWVGPVTTRSPSALKKP